MANANLNSMNLAFALSFLLLGGPLVWLALKLWSNADLDWRWTRRLNRYRGLKSKRTPEWERSRKIPLAMFLVLGVGCLFGGVAFAAHTLLESSRVAQREVRFDEMEVAECTLDRVTINNRGSGPHFVTIGPVRAGTVVTEHPGWPGRQVSVGMDALGDGMLSRQMLLDVSGTTTLEIAPGASGAFTFTPTSGSCKALPIPGAEDRCTKLIFGLKSAEAQGASPELDIVRYCDL